jgi:predicted Rossmann-fold nucleotide-binding protein
MTANLTASVPADLTAVCVFRGCNRGRDPRYGQVAGEVGRLLAEEGIGLVYGGGAVGLMGPWPRPRWRR